MPLVLSSHSQHRGEEVEIVDTACSATVQRLGSVWVIVITLNTILLCTCVFAKLSRYNCSLYITCT